MGIYVFECGCDVALRGYQNVSCRFCVFELVVVRICIVFVQCYELHGDRVLYKKSYYYHNYCYYITVTIIQMMMIML